jgi:hypothetical protein
LAAGATDENRPLVAYDLQQQLLGDISQHAFTVGGLVYCACCALEMTSNYRHIFVAMTLPQAWK